MSRHVDPAPRRASGQYSKHPPCECCGKPALDYCSDDDALALGGCAGLVLCERVRCAKRRDALDVAQRVDLYTRQGAANRAALKAGHNPEPVAVDQ